MENSSAILKCFQCLSTFCLYRLFCCLLRNNQNFSWIQKAVSTISQTLLPVLPVYSDCTRRTESSIKTETKSQDLHVLCNCSSLHICTVLCEMKSLLLKVEIRLRRQCWRGLESCSFQPTQATPGVCGLWAVLGYVVQGGLPGKHRESQEIRLLFPVVSISSCNGALLCHVCCFSKT